VSKSLVLQGYTLNNSFEHVNVKGVNIELVRKVYQSEWSTPLKYHMRLLEYDTHRYLQRLEYIKAISGGISTRVSSKQKKNLPDTIPVAPDTNCV